MESDHRLTASSTSLVRSLKIDGARVGQPERMKRVKDKETPAETQEMFGTEAILTSTRHETSHGSITMQRTRRHGKGKNNDERVSVPSVMSQQRAWAFIDRDCTDHMKKVVQAFTTKSVLFNVSSGTGGNDMIKVSTEDKRAINIYGTGEHYTCNHLLYIPVVKYDLVFCAKAVQ